MTLRRWRLTRKLRSAEQLLAEASALADTDGWRQACENLVVATREARKACEAPEQETRTAPVAGHMVRASLEAPQTAPQSP